MISSVEVFRDNWMGIDVETGDDHPDKGPLLSIGAVGSGGRAFEVKVLPQPGWGAVHAKAPDWNGYPEEWREAVPLWDGMMAFWKWIKDNFDRPMPIAHNKWFDRSFIEKAQLLSGVKLGLGYNWRCSMDAVQHAVDQVVMVAADQGQKAIGEAWADGRRVNMDSVLELLGLEVRKGHHNAREDAGLTLTVWEASVRGKTYEALWRDFEGFRRVSLECDDE